MKERVNEISDVDTSSEMIMIPRWQSMGVATIYAKTHLRIHLNPKYGIFLSKFRRFLDNTHTKGARKSNSYVSGIICSSTLFNGLPPINEVKDVLIHIRFNIVQR